MNIIISIIDIIGTVTLLLLLAYAAFHFYYKSVRKEQAAKFNLDKMPVLRPVPIPTNGRSGFMKLLVMIYEVRRWELQENWFYDHQDEDGKVRVVLPKGFRFDGASIPRPFWALLSPTGLLLVPGLIHDYGYRHDQLWQVDQAGNVSKWHKNEGKEFWDDLFLEVGKTVNDFAIIDKIAYIAVKWFGGRSWESNRALKLPITKPVVTQQPLRP